MADDQIFVDGELFLARTEEQNQFRQALRVALNTDKSDGAPYVFLIHGQDGIGKSKMIRRLRDIAARETPFEATTQTMLVDVTVERRKLPKQKDQLSTAQISRVFSMLYQAARDAGWGHQFSDYQAALRQLNRAEKSFIESVEAEAWGHQFSALRWFEADELGRLVRLQDLPEAKRLGVDSSTIDALAKAQGLDPAVARQALSWVSSRVQLEEDEDEILLAPNATFAKRLAIGFSKIAQTKPLVILLDSYENIGSDDPWVREVITNASSRVVWVIASSEDFEVTESELTTVPFDRQFRDHLTPCNLEALSDENVSAYLYSRAPDRLVTRASVEKIFDLSSGVPLAVQLCGDMWAGGVPVDDIVHGLSPEAPTSETIDQLSVRFLEYCTDPDDRRALVYLAIQPGPNDTILADVLQPGRGSFELRELLRRLAARYNSIYVNGGVKLHPAVRNALGRFLLRRRIRISEEVKAIAARASAAMEKSRAQLESSMARLEDRFENTEWRECMLDGLHWMFLDNEFNAWRQVTRDFVDALGYDVENAVNQLKTIDRIDMILSKNGRQRFQIFKVTMSLVQFEWDEDYEVTSESLDRNMESLAELERWLSRYGDKEIFAAERRAILDIRRGEIYFNHRRFDDALRVLLKAEKNVPPSGDSLNRQLAQNFERVGEQLAWRRKGHEIIEALPSPSAETSLKKSIALGNRKAKTYHSVGAVQEKLGKLEAALENLLQTVTLNPDNLLAWHDLGNVYRKQSLFDKAVPAYRRAIEIEPAHFRSRLYLAVCFRSLKDRDGFNDALGEMKSMSEGENEYNQACFQALAHQIQPALENLRIAIQQNQATRDNLINDPCFESIRGNQEFQTLIVTIPA